MSNRAAPFSPPPNAKPGRGRRGHRKRARSAALSLVVWSALVGAPSLAQDATALNRELAEIEGEAQGILREPVRATDMRSATFVEERLTDGELFLRLKDYLRAAIIFTDIVEHYPGHRAYPDALYLLGESLFEAGDLLGARTRFSQVLDRASDPMFRPYVQKSLARLIEIAIRTRTFEAVDRYFQSLDQLATSELESATAYFRAKYLYNRAVPADQILASPDDAPMMASVDTARLEQARQGFASIGASTPYTARAQYFVGTIHALRGEYTEAITAFLNAAGVQPADAKPNDEASQAPKTVREALALSLGEDVKSVRSQAYLSLGRLYYETEQLDRAVEAYRAVPRTSRFIDQALFELAWTYIRKGDATQAERALELLAVAAPRSPLNADGKVLRGNLLARAGRYEEAGVVFDELREEFDPIRNELEQIRIQHPDLHGHFRQLVRDNMEDFDIDDFLPESARQWIRLEGDYERALNVLSDLSEAKRLVDETDDLIDRLTTVLGAPNRVSVFADLRQDGEATTGLRNRLVRLRSQLMRAEYPGEQGAGASGSVRAQRVELEDAIRQMPIDGEDFVVRDGELLDRFRGLEKELQHLRVEVLGIEARIVAAGSVLQYSDPDKINAAEIRSELDAHAERLKGYQERMGKLDRALEAGRLQVGVGDKRYQRDSALRAQYIQLVGRERQLRGSGGAEFDRIHARIRAVEAQLDQRDAAVDAAVQQRVAEMLRVIEEESVNLEQYRAALAAVGAETEDVVGAITYLNFDRVRARFDDLVLKADVGRIDVAWAKREEHRTRIDVLTRERARELQALDDEFRDVMDETDGEDTQ